MSVCSEREVSLKKAGIIDNNINLQQRLADCLNVTLHPCNENESLTAVRMHCLRLFFMKNDFMTAKEFDDAINHNQYVRCKSYRWTMQIVKILTEQFHIPNHQIRDHINVLQVNPDNLQKLLTIKSIGDMNITDILLHTPSLMAVPYESVESTMQQLKKFGISDESITKCPRVLALDWKIVRSRLTEIKSRKEFQALAFHPNILKLVVNKFKAQSRLEHLHELDKECFNISALTGNFVQFQTFAGIENDRNSVKDCVLFLTKTFKAEAEFVKDEMCRHPYWRYIPFTEMKQTIEMLKRDGFELKDISANIHIFLYSGDLILNRLKKFRETKQIGGHCLTDLPKQLQLKLILYQIETKFNFSGDGVWLDRKLNLNFDRNGTK